MKRFILAALTLCALLGVGVDAGAYSRKVIPINWQRNDAGFSQAAYQTSIANGDHPHANVGIAVAVQDTSQGITLDDWFYRQRLNSMSAFPGNGTASDSTWLGTLNLDGTSSTIDSVVVFRDVSQDGFKWTVCDSQVVHINSGQSNLFTTPASDSSRFILTAVTNPTTGATITMHGAISFFVYPGMGLAGVTAQSALDVNFTRFRVHMSSGDYAAAGATNGLKATWEYPQGNDTHTVTQ